MSYEMNKDKIINILPSEYDYSIIGDYEFVSEQEFKCTLNIKKIHNEADAKKWITKLEECTLSTWRVRRTYPSSGKCNIYKIAMKCQHNVDNYKFKAAHERKKSHISKHTGCPSTLVLTIKRFVKNSKARLCKSSDPTLIEWPCFVELKYTHNHPLNTAEVLRFRPLSNDIKEKIKALFQKGHSPASALESIKLELFLNHNENYFEIALDRFYVPSISQVQYLFNQTFTVTNSKSNIVKPSLENLLIDYNSSISMGRAELGTIGKNKFVTICSPVMFRAHELLSHSSQVAVMETYGNIGKKNHFITFITTPTPAGAIPLGCIIADTDKQEVLNAALANLKRCFPSEKSFYKQKFPFVFITDDDSKKQNSLKLHWPESSLLLCQKYVVRCTWNWLNCNNSISKSMKEDIYYSLKQLIYCPFEKDLCNFYSSLHKKHSTLPKFISYLEKMWSSRSLWSSAYRSNISVSGNCFFNYVEVIFKIMKDCLIERIQNYNFIQLVDFILVHYEDFVKKKLLDFSQGNVSKSLLYKYIPPAHIINPSMIIPSEIDDTCYFVPDESEYAIKYMVDVKHGICSCENGKAGQLCKHLCGVIDHIKNPNNNFKVSENFKSTLYHIATGTDKHIQLMENECSPLVSPINNSDVEHVEENAVLKLTDKENKQLSDFFYSINDGLKNHSTLYVPAIKCMLKTYSKIKCDLKFLTSLKMFGKNIKPDIGNHNNSIQKKYKKKKKKFHNTPSKSFISILPKIHDNDDPLAT